MCGLGDSIDSTATHYGLNRLRDRIPVGAGFLDFVTVQTIHGPPRLLYSAYWVSFWRVKWLGHGVDYPLPLSVEVPSWPAVG